MATLTPKVHQLTAGGNAASDYMTILNTFFSGGGLTLWTYQTGKSESGQGFALTPNDVNETFSVVFRLENATDGIAVSIDPLDNVTDVGSLGVTPTLTDSSEWSEEAVNTQGTGYSTNLYVIELVDCLIVLFLDASEEYTPRAIMVGRVSVPYYTNGTNGYNYCDGLGILVGSPSLGTAGGWFPTTDTVESSRLRFAQTGGFAQGIITLTGAWATCYYTPGISTFIPRNGQTSLAPQKMICFPQSSSSGMDVGFSKYIARVSNNIGVQLPGRVLDSGVDAWIFINSTNAAQDEILIPWEQGVTPIF